MSGEPVDLADLAGLVAAAVLASAADRLGPYGGDMAITADTIRGTVPPQ